MSFHPAATLRDGRHYYPIRVYYEDTDAGGVVYHANYLRFAERARTEALRDLGVPHAEMASLHALMFMVRRVKVDYLDAARLDDSLVVVSWAAEIRGASVELHQQVVHAERPARPLAVLRLGLACVRLSDHRPARLPARWKAALQGLAGGLEFAPIGAQ